MKHLGFGGKLNTRQKLLCHVFRPPGYGQSVGIDCERWRLKEQEKLGVSDSWSNRRNAKRELIHKEKEGSPLARIQSKTGSYFFCQSSRREVEWIRITVIKRERHPGT